MRAPLKSACALLVTAVLVASLTAQTSSGPAKSQPDSTVKSTSILPLNISSVTSLPWETGGFMAPLKCDEEGNLYVRKYARYRPLLGPVARIRKDGKRDALFDPTAFSDLGLDRADAFSPAWDGGLYWIAQKGVVKPRIYVLHFSSDGSPSEPVLLAADFEVFTFAPFPSGNFLLSGIERDVTNPKDHGQTFTAVFLADGRMLARLTLKRSHGARQTGAMAPKNPMKGAANAVEPSDTANLDLSDAEVGRDGNLYVMQRSHSSALVFVISSTGEVVRKLRIPGPLPGGTPSAFHVSENRLAIGFENDHGHQNILVIADAWTGRKIASYSVSSDLAPRFACYSADEGIFTFLTLGEDNTLQVIRAEAR